MTEGVGARGCCRGNLVESIRRRSLADLPAGHSARDKRCPVQRGTLLWCLQLSPPGPRDEGSSPHGPDASRKSTGAERTAWGHTSGRCWLPRRT